MQSFRLQGVGTSVCTLIAENLSFFTRQSKNLEDYTNRTNESVSISTFNS
jgi:hypothetical protein